MLDKETREFYYSKGRLDYLEGRYDQPFPFPTKLELDEFEVSCNSAYNEGYKDERTCLESFSV